MDIDLFAKQDLFFKTIAVYSAKLLQYTAVYTVQEVSKKPSKYGNNRRTKSKIKQIHKPSNNTHIHPSAILLSNLVQLLTVTIFAFIVLLYNSN